MHKGQVAIILTTFPVFLIVVVAMLLLAGVAYVLPSHDVSTQVTTREHTLSLLSEQVVTPAGNRTIFELLLKESLSSEKYSDAFLTAWTSVLTRSPRDASLCYVLVLQERVTNQSLYLTTKPESGKISVNQGKKVNYLGDLRRSSSSVARGETLYVTLRGVPHRVYVGGGACNEAW